MSSTSPLNLPRSHCKSPFVTSSPFARSFPHVIVFSVKEPPSEDTEREFEERVSRSVLSAVDFERIKCAFPMVRIYCIHTNQIPNPPLQVNDRKPLRLLKTNSQPQNTTAPLLVLEVPLTMPLPPPWINRRLNVPPKPSPHQLPIGGFCCPIVLADPSHNHDSHEKKRRRKRGKPKNKNRLVP